MQRITEVEEVSYEPPQGGFGASPSSLSLPDRIFDVWLPQPECVSRQQLFDIANEYFDAVSHKIDYHDVPWHPECRAHRARSLHRQLDAVGRQLRR